MDFVRTVVDEIALEGLDGITLSALWIRLSRCEPAFNISLDADSKQYIWASVIVSHNELEFFVLEKPRLPILLIERPAAGTNENLTHNPDISEDPYPFKLVQDGNILGSCATYYTRKNITSELRSTNGGNNPSLENVMKKYGERLVIVANQNRRRRVLFNNDTDDEIPLSEKTYCMLERIGRARYSGETTQGRSSINKWMKENSKFIFYMKNKLSRYGLITSQTFMMCSEKGQPVCGKIMHLKKFTVEIKAPSIVLMEKLTRKLDAKPNKMEVLSVIRSEMNTTENSFRKLLSWGKNYIKAETRLIKDIFPEAEQSVHYHKNKKKLREVRVLRLLKVYTYSVDGKDDYLAEDDDGSGEVGDADADDELEDLENSDQSSIPLLYEVPLLHQVYDFLEKRGGVGANKNDILRAFKIPHLEARRVCCSLQRLGHIHKIMHDVGKQREQRYVIKSLVHTSTMHQELMEERRKILEHHRVNQKIKKDMSDTAVTTEVSDPGSSFDSVSCTSLKTDDRTPSKAELSLTESVLSLDDQQKYTPKHCHVTVKLLKRVNIILDAVKQAKVIDNLFNLYKRIVEEEKQENVKGRMDRKSLRRLVKRLEKSGQLKIFKSARKIDGVEKQVMLLCDVDMTPDHILVKSAIESAFNRMLVFDKDTKSKMTGKLKPELAFDPSKPSHSLLKSNIKISDMMFDLEIGRFYGYLPRMKRYQTVHEFLWYLVYGYGKPMFTPGGDSLILEDESVHFDKTLESANIPFPVYAEEASFRRFLPPLTQHSDYGPGWFLVGDVLLLLPLTIFLQVIRFSFKNVEIEKYLNDPILKWLPVCHLPTEIRRMLMFERRYIHQFYDVLQQMNQMGLITVGLRDFKEKEQIFMYLHKNSSIVDTVIPKLQPEERPIKRFHFDTAHSVRNYWFSLQWICTNTPLDHIKLCDAADQLSKSKNLKRFQDVIRGRAPYEVIDNGDIPGNREGAAGLDSCFFSHKKFHWTTAHTKATSTRNISSLSTDVTAEHSLPEETVTKSHAMEQKRKKNKKRKFQPSSGSHHESPTKKVAKTSSGEVVDISVVKGVKPRGGGKGIKHKRIKPQKSTVEKKMPKKAITKEKDRLDDLDRVAMTRMTKERSDWTSREDSMLLLWRVCLVFLCGWRRDSVVPYSIIRDYLHKELPESTNKTTMACKRRLANMMKIKDTVDHINLYVGEAFQDKELVKEFIKGQSYKKIYSQVEVRCEMITKCFEKLREKFMSGKRVPTLVLPDTKEELLKTYEFYKPVYLRTRELQEPQNKEDIHFTVLQNVIHCAILLDDKTCRAHELYHLLSHYPEQLVNEVFNSMKHDGIITKIKKGTIRRHSKLSSLPAIGMGTYMLSQRYTYFWITKYPRLIFTHCIEAYHPLTQLIASHTETDRPSKWIQVEGIAGYASLVIALMPSRRLIFEITIPEEIVTLDQSHPKKSSSEQADKQKTESDAEEEAMIDEAERLREQQVNTTGSGNDSGMKKQEGSTIRHTADPVNELQSAKVSHEEVTKKTAAEIDQPSPQADHVDARSGKTASNQIGDSLDSDLSGSVNPSSLIIDSSKCKPAGVSRAIISLSHNQHSYRPASLRHLDPLDHLVVNSCTIRAKLKGIDHKEPKLKWDFDFEAEQYIKEWNRNNTEIHPKTAFYLFKKLRTLQPAHLVMSEVITRLQSEGHCTKLEVALMVEIHDKVKESSFLGLTARELKVMYKDNTHFQRCLNLLLETKLLVRVGVTVFRYVSHHHARPWLIHSYKNLKGRGLPNQPDETEDLVHSLSLKDFPGAPSLPEDRAIKPGKPCTSELPGASFAHLIDQQETGIMMTKKRSMVDEDEARDAKKLKAGVCGQTISEALPEPDAAGADGAAASVVTAGSDDHNATMKVSDATAVIKTQCKRSSSLDETDKPAPEKSPRGSKYLLRTITPDQQVVEQKFVDKEELSFTGKGSKGPRRRSLKVESPEARCDTELKSPTASGVKSEFTPPLTPTDPGLGSSECNKESVVPSDDSVSVNDPPAVIGTIKKVKLTPGLVTLVENVAANRRPSTSEPTSDGRPDVIEQKFSASISAPADNVSVSPKRSASSDKRADVTKDRSSTSTSDSAENDSVNPKPSPSAVPSGNKTEVEGDESVMKQLSYTIQVKLPSNANLKEINIADIVKQVQALIKSGLIKVTATKAEILTVDIGKVQLLVSVMPKAPGQMNVNKTNAGLYTGQTDTDKTLAMTSSQQSNKSQASGPSGESDVIKPCSPSDSRAVSSSSTASFTTRSLSSTTSTGPPPASASSKRSKSYPGVARPKQIPEVESPTVSSITTRSMQTAATGSRPEREAAATSRITRSSSESRLHPSALAPARSVSSDPPAQPTVRQSRRLATRRKSSKWNQTLPQLDGTSDTKPTTDKGSVVEDDDQTRGDTTNKGYTFGRGLEAPPTKGTYLPVKLVCRPWKTPEGTVNRPILQMMLEGLLAYIMQKPGVTREALSEKYHSIMQPVPLMELTEMLEQVGCIYKVNIRSLQRPTLFSSRMSLEPDPLGDADEVIESVLPTSDCVLKMGQFISQCKSSRK